MSPTETTPARAGATEGEAVAFWNDLIDEQGAAGFLGLSIRTLQGYRYKGGGPKYLALSSRCVRYRRIDLRAWADNFSRTSTSDRGDANGGAR